MFPISSPSALETESFTKPGASPGSQRTPVILSPLPVLLEQQAIVCTISPSFSQGWGDSKVDIYTCEASVLPP